MLQELSALRNAEADRLERAVFAALNCLRRAARPIERAAIYLPGNGGRKRQSVVWLDGGLPVRGLIADDSYDIQSHGAGRSGFYVGTRLYLLTDGRFLQVRRHGVWTAHPGSTCHWSVCAVGTSVPWPLEQDPPVDDYIVSTREVVNLYDLGPVVTALTRAGRRVASGMQDSQS